MCPAVCSSQPHTQWAESVWPTLLSFLGPQWPVRRRKMVVWVLLSRILMWSFCGSYPLLFSLRFDFCFCFRRLLNSHCSIQVFISRDRLDSPTVRCPPSCGRMGIAPRIPWNSRIGDLQADTLVDNTHDAWRYRVSAPSMTEWDGRLNCNVYLVQLYGYIRPWNTLRMLLGCQASKQPTNGQEFL